MQVNDLSAKLRQEGRQLDRQIHGQRLYFKITLVKTIARYFNFLFGIAIEREEQKTILMIKAAAKKNQMEVCKVSAKSLVL